MAADRTEFQDRDVAFGLSGLLLLMPFQASAINGWLNAAGFTLGAGLIVYEYNALRRRR